MWNPIDLGYLNAYVTYRLATKAVTGQPGESFPAGRLGKITVEPQQGADRGVVFLGSLFRFDQRNIDQFKDVF